MSQPEVGLVGLGPVGTTLALGLANAGYRVAAVSSRRPSAAAELARQLPGARAAKDAQTVADVSGLVLLTVPDDAIAGVCASVHWRPEMAVVHCSGALGLEVLATAAARGATTGSFHPLQSFAGPPAETQARLRGATIALEGQGGLVATLTAMAKALGGHPLQLPPGSKALYHASAAFASAYVAVGVQQAVDLWGTFGIEPAEALRALLPLLRGTVANLERIGLPGALTGPVARGDVGTVRRHVAALAEQAPAQLPLYASLGLSAVDLGTARGTLSPTAAAEIRLIFARSARAADVN